ncbi:MAG: hypothetical protein UW64_C0016G0018 [Microgenomates group bacterium GW2011_GWC1_44_37]|uniref:Uncharacterized protein n=1 Tax=Candidatus Collierbacteria bacterium GW2011_GWB2_44_22 TaxID=1618387 RepID=A0A0G1K4Z8_9BACT|nr:MAG: hypothetical protein UW31_C0006G0076 [Candidatus Collierbacteria bacterium GW2011_GWA2_44_13]KKT51357.1 MAG: hypothetical protein UW44_C0013G0077 [Candidatus Collierbacteria bacterium GW2011_GWB2_44_22]KKT61465.1 MAG: hypothetical protein UW56_C0025G0002 [Candidatus Collierbacteria bacterium GW2011_GWD1_44_27]KKT68559.1 MAG: hypothetical protein UW64_C0016G0018 [Microgenomates group bacterium GW2011_GWC1_44_37]KKT88400.1 MAG: hypothetical protein UW88_C0011G0040 [Candidatus Collierbacte
MTYTSKIIILITLAIIVGYLISSEKSRPTVFQTNPQTENIQDDSGLNQAQDEMDTINVDSLDSGINQLNSEAYTF